MQFSVGLDKMKPTMMQFSLIITTPPLHIMQINSQTQHLEEVFTQYAISTRTKVSSPNCLYGNSVTIRNTEQNFGPHWSHTSATACFLTNILRISPWQLMELKCEGIQT